mmetsp:Transcript_26204/g.19689  ORF Transcript_26204/g.19689 Transcript_26204/m.19689 type:complete len:84 (-) Transcript_26204:59-310(-)
MSVSGLYSSSMDFLLTYGVASKSGVSGALLTVIPGVGSLVTHSSPLDSNGNSYKGLVFIDQFAKKYDIDLFIFHDDKTQLYFS